ncbi:hypothetical protein JL720_3172 [Aureococcus anophagefferens]|nr:hypothetical protein JL720_3172 [Aureococcus anophagefferens]
MGSPDRKSRSRSRSPAKRSARRTASAPPRPLRQPRPRALRRDRSRSRSRGRDDRGGGGGGYGKASGVACRWNERGFGFIKPDDGGDDLFCHVSQITDGNALSEGATVHFVKVFDERRGKDRAEQVTGGITAQDGGGGGYGGAAAGGGGGYGGGGYGGGGGSTDLLRLPEGPLHARL